MVAAVGIPTALVLVVLGGWPLAGALAILAAVGALELYRLAGVGHVRPFDALGMAGAAAAPVVFLLLGTSPSSTELRWIGFGAVGWLLAILAGAVWRRPPTERPLAAAAVTVFGAVYAGLLPAFLVLLREAPQVETWTATWLVFLPLAVTWICDSMAMAGGSLVGGPKFAPVVSPNKTWAGTISGSLAATVVAPVYGAVLLAPRGISLAWWELSLFGLILSVVGQVGDLAESLLKREAGVKDSGGFFPGHGGVLDRLDSLYWALPTAVLLLAAYGVL